MSGRGVGLARSYCRFQPGVFIVSDYVCPYCIAAKAAMLPALLPEDTVEWLPYELTPETKPRVDTYHDPVRAKKWAESLVPACKALGLDVKLPPKVIPRPYTRLAFEGYHFACDHGLGEAYNARMYDAYFRDELDIGELSVLRALAEEIGLPGDAFEQALKNGVYTEKQKELNAYTHEVLQVKGVPTIFIDGQKVEGGVYTTEDWRKLLRDAEEAQKAQGAFCSADGNCGF